METIAYIKKPITITAEYLEAKLGLKEGEIVSVEYSIEGSLFITFKNSPGEDILQKLDLLIPSLRREGALSIGERVNQVEDKVATSINSK